MTTIKSTFEKVQELTNVKDVFNNVSIGFSVEFEKGRYTQYHEIGETILQFVRDCSTSFCSDIASKALEFGNPSEKQAWCVSFEFIKIKHQYDAWVEEITKNL